MLERTQEQRIKRGFDLLLQYLFFIILLLTPFCFDYGNKNMLKFYLHKLKKEHFLKKQV